MQLSPLPAIYFGGTLRSDVVIMVSLKLKFANTFMSIFVKRLSDKMPVGLQRRLLQMNANTTIAKRMTPEHKALAGT